MKGSRVAFWAVGWWLCIFLVWSFAATVAASESKEYDERIREPGYLERIALRTGRSEHRIEKRSRSREAMLRLGRAKSQDIYLRFGRGGAASAGGGEVYVDTGLSEEPSGGIFEERVPKAAQDTYLRLGRARLPDSFRHQQTYLRLGRGGGGVAAVDPVADDLQPPPEALEDYPRLG